MDTWSRCLCNVMRMCASFVLSKSTIIKLGGILGLMAHYIRAYIFVIFLIVIALLLSLTLKARVLLDDTGYSPEKLLQQLTGAR